MLQGKEKRKPDPKIVSKVEPAFMMDYHQPKS